MRRKLAALALCALLAAVAVLPWAGAAQSVCFVAAGEYVLPLSDGTMPFWSGGYLYVSSTIFTGLVQDALSVSVLPTGKDRPTILSGGGQSQMSKSLWFERDLAYAHDIDGNRYYPGGIRRGGVTFVPASLVARFFNLEYSMIPVEAGGVSSSLVWLRQTGYILSDKEFANAATFRLESCYADYLRGREERPEPEPPAAAGEPEEERPEADGKTVYLCLAAGDGAGALLDELDRAGARAAFFCSQDFLDSQGDLLRRMTASGHGVGILADGADRPVLEQLEAGNAALERATCGKTRLALIQNGDSRDLQEAREAGYRCLAPDLDRYGLRTAAQASALLQRISARRDERAAVWAGDGVTAGGLRAFLAALEEAEGRCLAWTETA